MHEVLGPDTVVESVLFDDRAAEEPREVDVVVYKRGVGRENHIAIECVDWNVPADVTWVEQMIGKHNDIGTDQLILVSANGFSRGARKKAHFHGIKLITPEPDPEWGAEVLRTVQQRYLSRTTMSVVRCSITVVVDGGEKRGPAEPDLNLFNHDGSPRARLRDYVAELLSNRSMQREVVLGAKSHPEAGWFQIGLRPLNPSPTLVHAALIPNEAPRDDSTNSGMSLRNENGQLEPIVDIEVVGQLGHVEGTARLKIGIIDGKRVIWGTATIGGDNVMVSAVGNDSRVHRGAARKPRTVRKKRRPK